MRHVRFCSSGRVELTESAQQLAHATVNALQPSRAVSSLIYHEQLDKRDDVALLDRQATIHIQFAECELGINCQTNDSPPIVQSECDLRVARTECVGGSIRTNYCEFARFDEFPQDA